MKHEKDLRFAIIGCGAISDNHALSIIENGSKLVACCDNVEINAIGFAEKYDIDWYTDYKEMIKRNDIDVVCICTPSGTHADISMEVSRYKKHIVVEKPMDITLEQADRMINACNENNVKLSVISQHRFDDSTMFLKKAVEEGQLGKLILGDAAIKWYRSQEYYDSGEWRGTWEIDGGGALMNQGIHTIDLLQYIMGGIESLTANIGTLGHARINVEDVATVTIRFKNGALGTIVGTTCAYPGLSARLEIHGNEGTAIIDNDQLTYFHTKEKLVDQMKLNSVSKKTGGTSPEINYFGHKKQIKDMIEAILNDREPLVNGEEGKKPLEIILAIYSSAKTGETVNPSQKVEQE